MLGDPREMIDVPDVDPEADPCATLSDLAVCFESRQHDLAATRGHSTAVHIAGMYCSTYSPLQLQGSAVVHIADQAVDSQVDRRSFHRAAKHSGAVKGDLLSGRVSRARFMWRLRDLTVEVLDGSGHAQDFRP
jgi:hypothetical protein